MKIQFKYAAVEFKFLRKKENLQKLSPYIKRKNFRSEFYMPSLRHTA